MSELINNSQMRKSTLKALILKLHEGANPDQVRRELEETLSGIPYGEVVEVEQELVAEGLPETEIQKLCDIHSFVLQGSIDLTTFKITPPGHPIDTFEKENREIEKLVDEIEKAAKHIISIESIGNIKEILIPIRAKLNSLMDIDKHYKRKEYLLFPFLEKLGITAPPKVMWGKHDEIREMLKGTIEATAEVDDKDDFAIIYKTLIKPTLDVVLDMIVKEEKILFPMSSDKLTELDWYEIYKQTSDYGYCLFDPKIEWKPKNMPASEQSKVDSSDALNFPTGKLNYDEILGILNTIPLDMTFVDKDDKVRYFTDSKERVFERSRAILLRDVRMCHPPSSVHIVDKILEDFKNGRENKARFWINLHGKFVMIEYYAVRGQDGEYLGTLEVTQDLTEIKSLEGEQRLLSYEKR